uniref:Uncharacterized protein n=1 Tax=Oryza barthii TaxID=65489 RepID=A0A0D3H5G0_9ORYZ
MTSADPARHSCGHGSDGRLRVVGEEVAHRAAAPPLRARRDLCGGELHDGHLHNTPPSMSGATANKNLTYAIHCEDLQVR